MIEKSMAARVVMDFSIVLASGRYVEPVPMDVYF
jgi:hypothetical protein